MKLTHSEGIYTYVGKSSETKPTDLSYSDPVFFFEADTGDLYWYDEEENDWTAVGGE